MAASKALSDKFKDRAPSKTFGDEGEPEMSESNRGSGAGADMGSDDSDDTEAPMDAGAGGSSQPPMDPVQKATDDLADILGVGPEDRDDFAAALQTVMAGVMTSAMGPQDMGSPDMGGAPDEGMPTASNYQGMPGSTR